MRIIVCFAVLAAAFCSLTVTLPAFAANHREAPLTALDHKADIADFFAFVSYDDPSKVTFILDVDPLLEPANGPNYFPFDPEILYSIKIDNNHDAVRDVEFQFRFKTEIRLPGVFTGLVGAGGGVEAPANSPAPVPPGTLIVPPAITALDGEGSEGLSLRQNYSVTVVRRGAGASSGQVFCVGLRGSVLARCLFANRNRPPADRSERLAEGLFAVPTNVGGRTMPEYASLAEQGVYEVDDDIRVFAGTVEDPFWIDLGAAFDSLNFRASAFDTGVPGVLGDAQDADDTQNFAPDDVSGFNVNAIAIEVPISMITADGEMHDAGDPLATIGAWATTSRPKTKVYAGPGEPARVSGKFVQIQRMANPLFNELIIGTGFKDKFSMSEPKDDAQFADFALDPVLARVLNAVYDATVAPGVLPIPAPPRLDLLPLVQYGPPIAAPGTEPGPIADLLRLNTGIPPTPADRRSRLAFLTLLDDNPDNDDPAGWPNGRRVSDDVTDIAARAVAGVLAGPEFSGFPHNRIGDGVNANDVEYSETFPYLGLAHSGRDSRHVDPGE